MLKSSRITTPIIAAYFLNWKKIFQILEFLFEEKLQHFVKFTNILSEQKSIIPIGMMYNQNITRLSMQNPIYQWSNETSISIGNNEKKITSILLFFF